MSKQSRTSIQKANFKQAKVLVIDDSADQCVLIQHAMHTCLAEVELLQVTTIEQVGGLVRQWQYQEWELPKLILLDLYMPERADGLALLEQLKALPPPLGLIPIVMLSSSAASQDIDQAYHLGASAYLVKPTEFTGWLRCFEALRHYWWETVSLPPMQYGLSPM